MANIVFGHYVKKERKPIHPPTLKKFMVHFRRPDNYQGTYGFDWLRDEYIYSMGSATPYNTGISALKTEYKTTDVVNPISPYGKDYYPAWLSIFPYTRTEDFAHGSRIHQNGITLDLEIEELEALSSDATELAFEPGDPNLHVSPKKIALQTLLGTKQTKSLGAGNSRDYYLNRNKINIKSKDAPLSRHTEIKVFAQLGSQKEEVGKLMVYKNNVIPKAEFVVINVKTSTTTANLRNDYQFNIARQSFNQALIRAAVDVDTNFDINSLPAADRDVINFKSNYIGKPGNDITSGLSRTAARAITRSFKADVISLYEKHGVHVPASGTIDGSSNKKTYLFFTDIKAGGVRGSATLSGGVWGNAYIVYDAGLLNRRTICHEAGHSFSLPHTFETVGPPPHHFKQGYTDNIMDYTWGPGGSNPFDKNDKMFSFFKWQWDILRRDRSLIHTY